MKTVRLALVAAAACTLGATQAPPPPPPFAPVTARGGLVFVSGILPSPAAGDVAAQAAQVLDELKARLARAGTSIDRVASVSVYLSSADDFAALNAVWKRYWPTSPPARTTVVAKLPVPGARMQVSAVAAAQGIERRVVRPEGLASTGGAAQPRCARRRHALSVGTRAAPRRGQHPRDRRHRSADRARSSRTPRRSSAPRDTR